MGSCETTASCERPFVGSRSFTYSDHEYFFGRDDEIEALNFQVKQHRFVAVVGRSGCGKSSLINAGVRAKLRAISDFQWHWVEMRPADEPVRNLALALAGLTTDTGDVLQASADRFERVLALSSFGIGEVLAQISAERRWKGNRVLLFVDQFEELFQFAALRPENIDSTTVAERREESTKFVRLILTAMKSAMPIHIIVSMRSDFLGHCAGFHGLPEAVSRSQYLVPGMTRDQREDVICKPVQLAGGHIDPILIQRALNDTNEDPDQLGNLQHTMMRCWERAYHRFKQEVVQRPHLTIDDYRKVGGVASTRHAA
jgi:energy-coupling factor transporter ATP-binding protein EcfA2